MKHSKSLLLLAALASTSAVQAAVLVDYKMTAAGDLLSGTPTNAPTSFAANVTATSILNQAGASQNGSQNYNNGTDRVTIWNTATGSGTNTGFDNAFTTGNYITFSITAAQGYTVTFTNITFQAAAATSTASDRSVYLVSATSLANFSASSTVLGSARTTTGGGTMPLQPTSATATVPGDYDFNLASLGAIASGETRYFRFYLQTPNASQGIAFDDIVVNGTVSPVSQVPEPASYAALAGLAGLGFVGTRRRRA